VTTHDAYSTWRENIHDDLVLSVVMTCWLAEKVEVGTPTVALDLEGLRRESPWQGGE